jgi:hypothetical protein
MKIRQFTNLPGISTSLKIAAATSLVMGVVAGVSAAPAGAVLLTTGELSFQNGTTNFFEGVNPGAGDTFNLQFNPGSLALVTTASGSFGSSFPITPLAYTLAPSPSATFTYVSAVPGSTFDYRLTSGNVPFTFTNGVNLTIANNSLFRGAFNSITGGVDFGIVNSAGSFFSNPDGVVPTGTVAFSFGDIPGGSGGGYQIVATPAAQVPEPFTIIGTIVGGTAAFRMRKKLANAAKN